MPKNVLITPGSGLVQFYDDGGNVDATIQLNDSNVLNITGTVSLGDLAANVYIGDGVNVVDIIFEQNGAVRALAGKTLTLGQSNSFISLAANITSGANITGNINTSGNISANYVLGNIYFATGFSASKIFNGLSEVNIGTANGAANISIAGTSNVAVFSATGLAITGDLSVSGNATLSGNILGDRIQNGTTQIDIQTASGNANVSVSGTSNVAVFASTGVFVTGVNSVSGNVTGGNVITAGLVTATGNINTSANVSAVGNITGNYFVGNGSQLTGILTGNSFGTIVVSGQSNVVADSASDTLTLVAGSGIAITTNSGNDSVTISQVATDSIFATGGDMGTVTEVVTVSEDLGLITSAATVEYDLGTLTTGGIVTPSYLLLPSYTVSQLASLTANPAGQFVFCSNESGGSVPAFSDGTNWRRVTDRAIVS